jgi:hypothetical protein
VKLVEAAPVAGALRFQLLSEVRIVPRSERSRGRVTGPRRGKRPPRRR